MTRTRVPGELSFFAGAAGGDCASPDDRREVSGVAGGRGASRCAPLAGAAGDCRVLFGAGREVGGVRPSRPSWPLLPAG